MGWSLQGKLHDGVETEWNGWRDIPGLVLFLSPLVRLGIPRGEITGEGRVEKCQVYGMINGIVRYLEFCKNEEQKNK